jgi:uncharacterized protein YbaR (Trm112 family)
MQKYILEMLECPACHHELDWEIEEQANHRIEQAQACCVVCEATYPVRDGIGIFLTPELSRNDLWEQVESQLSAYLRDHPDQERSLMEPPVEELSATDQQFRAQLLEARGEFAEARRAEELAIKNLYTDAYNRCWQSQVEYTLERVESREGPIVDLASGRGYLVEQIAGRLKKPVVATDFSLNVLRRNRAYFEFLGLYEHVSLLAFDARKTPFREDSIKTLTTNVGLPNIEDLGDLLHELARISSGTLFAISHFFLPDDEANRTVIQEAGLEPMLFKQSALDRFEEAAWDVEIDSTCVSEALPTPASEIFEGTRADGLPVVPTEVEWCVLRATVRE